MFIQQNISSKFSLRLMTCVAIVYWPDNSVRYRFHPVGLNLNPIIKGLVTLMTFMPLLHPQAFLSRTIIIVSYQIHSRGQLMITPTGCRAPSITMKASQQGLNFFHYNSISSCCTIQICGVFRNRVLLSSYRRPPRALAMSCIDY